MQGEALGIFQSVQAMAWLLAPLLSGALLNLHITMPIYVGGATVLLAGLIYGSIAGNDQSLEGLKK